MFEIDLTFPHSYEIEEPPEPPGTGGFKFPVLYFPRPKNRLEHDGLWLRIRPATGESWVGVFAFGYDSPPAISRVVSSPDPDRAWVISRGGAYIVKASEPGSCEEIPIVPVLDVRSIPNYQLIVFAGFTDLTAYGRNGLVWQSPRLCWDQLKILDVTHDTIEGVGYDPINLGESKFSVDIKSGRSLFPGPVSTNGRPVW